MQAGVAAEVLHLQLTGIKQVVGVVCGESHRLRRPKGITDKNDGRA